MHPAISIKICLLLERKPNWFETEKGVLVGGWKEVQRQDEDRVTLLKVRVSFFFWPVLWGNPILVLLVLWFWNCSRTRNSRLQPTKFKGPPNTGLNFKNSQVLEIWALGILSRSLSSFYLPWGEVASTLIPWKKPQNLFEIVSKISWISHS